VRSAAEIQGGSISVKQASGKTIFEIIFPNVLAPRVTIKGSDGGIQTMTGMNKLMYLIMFVTVCIFVLLLPLMDYIPEIAGQ